MKSERAKSLSTLKSPTVLKAVTIAVLSMVLFSTTHVSVRFLSVSNRRSIGRYKMMPRRSGGNLIGFV